MTWKRVALSLVLILFAEMTYVVVAEHGYQGFFDLALANSATALLFFDLVICLTLMAIWMVADARARGRNPWPYLIVALFFGAAGPLLYLIVREGRPAQDRTERAVPAEA